MNEHRRLLSGRRRYLPLALVLMLIPVFVWNRQPRASFVEPPFEIGGTITLIVVDENENRVAEATIVPDGFRAVQDPGSFYSWIEDKHGPLSIVTTDQDGIAQIPYPKWVDPKSALLTSGLVVTVEHPDFCLETNVNCYLPQAGTVTPIPKAHLKQGGRLRIRAYREGSKEPLARFHSVVSGDHYSIGWKTDGESRLSPNYAPGLHVIRIADHTDPAALQFSEAIVFEAIGGKTEDLDIQLEPGLVVRGQLDAPLPVRNGHVVVEILDLAAGPTSSWNQYTVWRTWTTVAENGEFEIRNLPPTTSLRMLAWCDGYVCQMPEFSTIPLFAKSTEIKRLQQFFTIGPETNFCRIAMEPCARCAVTVVGTDGRPVEGIRVDFCPNVMAGPSGSAWFGHGTRDEMDAVEPDISYADYAKKKLLKSAQIQPKSPDVLWPEYGGLTDAKGKVLIANLPGRGKEGLNVEHDRFVVSGTAKPPFRTNLQIDLQPGKTEEVSIVVEPKPAITDAMLTPPPPTSPTVFQRLTEFLEEHFGW